TVRSLLAGEGWPLPRSAGSRQAPGRDCFVSWVVFWVAGAESSTPRGAPWGVEDSAPATQQALPNQGHVLGNGDTLLACAVLPVRALLVYLPQSAHHVLAARGQHPAVGRQSDRVDTALVPFQALKQLAAAGVPEPGRLVSATAQENLAVGRKRDRTYRTLVAVARPHQRPRHL